MDIGSFLIACIPILSFGLIPVVATYLGGKPVEQSMGISLGSLAFALVVFFIRQPDFTTAIFLISMLSGVFWAIGSVGQFMGIQYLGVAKSMPISNGGQIIGTSLVGVLLGEWATTQSRVYGFIALALIIVGIVFTSYKDKKDGSKEQWGKGLLINLVSVIGFTCYVGVLKYAKIDGWTSILPQSLGQITGIFLIAMILFRTQPFNKPSLKNGIVGIIWAVGNLALLLSQAKIGLAVAYPMSQAAVIVSVFGGVFINKEKKDRKEWIYTGIGMAIIVVGLFLIYLSSVHDQPA
ncbi:MAG: GRP family sugar transporter [Bacteroides sp.]|nr:GRP family sugar transporter [Bacteroides sp.]